MPGQNITCESLFEKRILLVDDEKDITDLLEKVLRRDGFNNILKAASGQKAVNLCKMHQPEAVVLDIMLPDIDGIEVCKKIREFSYCPIMFLSSKNDDIDKILGLSSGGDDYVTKPFSPREIVFRIKAQLLYMQRKHFVFKLIGKLQIVDEFLSISCIFHSDKCKSSILFLRLKTILNFIEKVGACFKIILKYIINNIRERKLRTAVMLLSIVLSTTLLFVSLAIGDSYESAQQKKAKGLAGTATISVSAKPDASGNMVWISEEDIPQLASVKNKVGFLTASALYSEDS